MNLKTLAQGIGRLHCGDASVPDISSITSDSRAVRSGSLFVAIHGERFDGHRFIPSALQSGAVAVLSQEPQKVPEGVPVLEVDHTRRAMAQLARRLHGQPDEQLEVIGVTGTNGKTTCVHMLGHLLQEQGCARLGTLAYYDGRHEMPAPRTTPESSEVYAVLGRSRDNGCRYAALEISSHAMTLDRVYSLQLQTGIFTNLSQDHLDYHGDMETYFRAKAAMFQLIAPGGCAILNGDDPYGRRITLPSGVRRLVYGSRPEADLRFEVLEGTLLHSHFALSYGGERVAIHLPLPGLHNVYNFVACAGTLLCRDIPLEKIAAAAIGLHGVPGRMELLDEGQDFAVAVDYAHTPDALEKVLASCKTLRPNHLIVVFGAGGDRDKEKRKPMGEAVAQYADLAVLTSDNPRGEDPAAIAEQVRQGLASMDQDQVVVQLDRRGAIETAIGAAGNGDLVVIAGKGHETCQIIGNQVLDFDDRLVARNFLRQRIGEKTC